MVYHSVPDPNKIYPDHMTNFELTKFEIHDVTFTPDGLISHVDATVTSAFSLEMTLTRAEVIGFMTRQGMNVYFKGKKLILDHVDNIPFIHLVASEEKRDIME
ncbi:MAG: hypothetical protein CVU43_09720 [Chloroflexi bacterium HGW-Chloroflexi-5]|jgi:hypothetical protein|nr:MAG: hypothetical protein CVU43_09720 [Chloroflexi bacterium HGW-Chloroflexi-5]